VIELVIDELAVHGLSPGDAHAAAAAIETKLAELAAEGDVYRPRAEAFRKLAPVTADSPGALGEAVAGAVWGAVSR
jgi:hypothetical protein